MTDYMGELTSALHAWLASQDLGSAGVSMVDLQLSDRYAEHPDVDVALRELTGDTLRYLLTVDAAARADGDPVAHHRDTVEPGDELRYAAARLEILTNPLGFAHDADLAWPDTAAAVLTEIARASAALSSLVELGTEKVLAGLRAGALVALTPAEGQTGCRTRPRSPMPKPGWPRPRRRSCVRLRPASARWPSRSLHCR